ncbi:hypothetical protein [Geodermatophilus ruber]|uniref:Uncharacterized protein n=1 Tax=Geodermatophilus ruber TaxID=504800 RepID=A0A1I4ARU4_9ACTN|nr:hypothetical protein [Geodermatophilus ruber]SFK58439.1 hypothetical protein SAMN04488085_102337 [Geodermatophilus ruber]
MATYAHVPAAAQLRAAISILGSAAADRHWGNGDVVRVRPGGLQLGDTPEPVDAATVYQAARGLVGALLDDLVQATGRDLDDVVAPWLLSLQLDEAVADVETDGAA